MPCSSRRLGNLQRPYGLRSRRMVAWGASSARVATEGVDGDAWHAPACEQLRGLDGSEPKLCFSTLSRCTAGSLLCPAGTVLERVRAWLAGRAHSDSDDATGTGGDCRVGGDRGYGGTQSWIQPHTAYPRNWAFPRSVWGLWTRCEGDGEGRRWKMIRGGDWGGERRAEGESLRPMSLELHRAFARHARRSLAAEQVHLLTLGLG